MRITAVTSVRDEGPFLLEWIAWHRVIGVTDFLIASNDCSDGTDHMLDLLAQAGVVVHLPQAEQQAGAAAQKSVQWRALKSAWRHPLRKECDWMLVSDVDEFPMVHCGGHRLPDLIAEVEARAKQAASGQKTSAEADERRGGGSLVDAIALPWRLFGFAGQVHFQDQPVTQSFLRAAPPNMAIPIDATFFKSLFRPRAFADIGVHRPAHRKQYTPLWFDGAGQSFPPHLQDEKRMSLLPRHAARDLVELYHYSLRSLESFMVKTARGLPNRRDKAIDLAYWVARNFNLEEVAQARYFAKDLAEEILRLRAISGLADLHNKACEHARARFSQIVETPEGFQLWASAMQAGSSTIIPDSLAALVYRQFAKIKS